MSAGAAASIHARLLALAKARGEDFNLTLNRYALERFLYRLSISPSREHYWLIDADFRVHVSRRILEQRDGPTLEALKRLHSNRIYLPSRGKDRPDQDRLAMRFAQFKERA